LDPGFLVSSRPAPGFLDRGKGKRQDLTPFSRSAV
jgi:hypothetical protein